MRRIGIMGLTAMLASCAPPPVDDPANVPRLGRWRDESRAIGVTIDDQSVPLEELPASLRADMEKGAKSKELCTEPRVRDAQEATRLLRAQLPECTMEQWTQDGATLTGLARCAPQDVNGAQATPTVRAEGMVGATYLRLDIQSILRIPEPSGASHSAVLRLRRTLERIGDC
ncbi:Protein of unknown function [Sphingobium sp. AP50]|uniref:DUF3617 family protein n=1 Tax=Sphingobium sp. AP50 TaxID=1884369 RepID=UPI0008CAE803|nr:DUF3617 family protein [Sphingobium sp. AP50]SEI63421.1 Protein of unknown function [Sphingobium sp. AP50]